MRVLAYIFLVLGSIYLFSVVNHLFGGREVALIEVGIYSIFSYGLSIVFYKCYEVKFKAPWLLLGGLFIFTLGLLIASVLINTEEKLRNMNFYISVFISLFSVIGGPIIIWFSWATHIKRHKDNA